MSQVDVQVSVGWANLVLREIRVACCRFLVIVRRESSESYVGVR